MDSGSRTPCANALVLEIMRFEDELVLLLKEQADAVVALHWDLEPLVDEVVALEESTILDMLAPPGPMGVDRQGH